MIHIFVINQYAGNQHFEDELLSKIEKSENLEYYVFNTRHAGDESAAVRQALQIFEGEKLRFYCCGGSGTMRNMLSGFESLEDVEIAFIPCGITNDFLKVFKEDEKLFTDPANLINGKVINIDYMKTNKGICLNTISWGWDSAYIEGLDENRIFHVFGHMIPNIFAFIYAGTHAKSRLLDITLDSKHYVNKYSEIILGNGTTIGGIIRFAESRDITDGKASYCAIPDVHGIPMIKMFKKLINNNLLGLKESVHLGTCNSVHIRSVDGTPLALNFDGELQEESTEWDIQIVRKGLKFVVPREVQGFE